MSKKTSVSGFSIAFRKKERHCEPDCDLQRTVGPPLHPREQEDEYGVAEKWRGAQAKTRLSAGKVLATVFWDSRGMLLIDFLHDRKTVNAAYYCQLLDDVRATYLNKQ